ncbi:uncharacterized protein LOC131042854 [Cryptomeria japonica]|uniref:uncharacterized protein LOC131042854 n=1 Tax=Cryptomeria japonica TaxID=3369 RepID=UPI0027DA6FC1|nr:uncharacterized protein LOC131042854 [Cryptomeria japonica]
MLECSFNTACTPPPPSWLSNFLNKFNGDKPESCPFYFKWIVADLWPWKESGITLQMVEEAKKMASFRLMIVDGRLFVEIYKKCYQTRDFFTIWGFSQLLKLYPGMVPDLDLMFNCDDRPLVSRFTYTTTKDPPPLFRYCGHADFYDIPFPDWSYWGWVEVRSSPWDILIREIRNGSEEMKWVNRNPIAYWKGNPTVARIRMELLKCSKIPNWNGQLIVQRDKTGEGRSEKGLNIPNCLNNASTEKMCESLNNTVNWGNSHTEEAMEIGNAGSDFLLNELKMKHVYDYMFHVLTKYAKLLKYKPFVTKNSMEYCSEAMMCFANEVEKQYMKDTLITTRSPSPPCDIGELHANIEAIKEYAEENKETQFNVKWVEEK